MTQLTTQNAIAILKKYSSVLETIQLDFTAKQELQQAIIVIAELSDYQNLGICADNLEEGWQALNSYLSILGYPSQLQPTNLEPDSAIYIKFNTQKLTHYFDIYEGKDRGVLIAYQGEDLEAMRTYGYFPLNILE